MATGHTSVVREMYRRNCSISAKIRESNIIWPVTLPPRQFWNECGKLWTDLRQDLYCRSDSVANARAWGDVSIVVDSLLAYFGMRAIFSGN